MLTRICLGLLDGSSSGAAPEYRTDMVVEGRRRQMRVTSLEGVGIVATNWRIKLYASRCQVQHLCPTTTVVFSSNPFGLQGQVSSSDLFHLYVLISN